MKHRARFEITIVLAACLVGAFSGVAGATHINGKNLGHSVLDPGTLYVVYASPMFNGIGYASQQAISYAPYGAGNAVANRSASLDYYGILHAEN